MASLVSLLVLLLSIFATISLSFSISQASSYNYRPGIPILDTKVMNVIDTCWRTKSNWAQHRQALADCAVGFGRRAIGGKGGATYVVTDESDDDPANPKPGTLRYGVVQLQPLWIVFARDMVITLQNELIVASYKTIDGRGVKVEIADGPCITLQDISNVIIHGVSIHDCKPGKPGMVKSNTTHTGFRRGSDGDGISIFHSSNIWIDHCFLARCSDGLIDVIKGSTAITISNNYFTQHNEVMLCGHDDENMEDTAMKVTVAFNHFGPGLIQRMPRVRLGYAHVANNKYDKWGMYAIGGSANPTILSEGNYFIAPDTPFAKQVTKREENSEGWTNWNWRSSRDAFSNGAYFVQSGHGSSSPNYDVSQRFLVSDGSMVPALTMDAGPLGCSPNMACFTL